MKALRQNHIRDCFLKILYILIFSNISCLYESAYNYNISKAKIKIDTNKNNIYNISFIKKHEQKNLLSLISLLLLSYANVVCGEVIRIPSSGSTLIGNKMILGNDGSSYWILGKNGSNLLGSLNKINSEFELVISKNVNGFSEIIDGFENFFDDLFVVGAAIDSNGYTDIIWSKITSNNDYSNISLCSIFGEELNDDPVFINSFQNLLVIAGNTENYSLTLKNNLFLKFNISSGKFIEGFVYGDDQNDEAIGAVISGDNLIIAGNRGLSFTQIYFTYININSGDIIDTILLETLSSSKILSIKNDAFGGIIFSGESNTGFGQKNGLYGQITSSRILSWLWDSSLIFDENIGTISLNDIVQSFDFSYVILGFVENLRNLDNPLPNILFINLNSNGIFENSFQFGGGGEDFGISVIENIMMQIVYLANSNSASFLSTSISSNAVVIGETICNSNDLDLQITNRTNTPISSISFSAFSLPDSSINSSLCNIINQNTDTSNPCDSESNADIFYPRFELYIIFICYIIYFFNIIL